MKDKRINIRLDLGYNHLDEETARKLKRIKRLKDKRNELDEKILRLKAEFRDFIELT